MLSRKIAKGCFTLEVKSGCSEHLLLATVTRIAPFVSYVRTMYKDWKSGGSALPGNPKLYGPQGGSRSWEFGYREVGTYCRRSTLVQVRRDDEPAVEDTAWKGETGRIDDLVRKYTDR
jgi:ferredoxin--NADP+ reductase